MRLNSTESSALPGMIFSVLVIKREDTWAQYNYWVTLYIHLPIDADEESKLYHASAECRLPTSLSHCQLFAPSYQMSQCHSAFFLVTSYPVLISLSLSYKKVIMKTGEKLTLFLYSIQTKVNLQELIISTWN